MQHTAALCQSLLSNFKTARAFAVCVLHHQVMHAGKACTHAVVVVVVWWLIPARLACMPAVKLIGGMPRVRSRPREWFAPLWTMALPCWA